MILGIFAQATPTLDRNIPPYISDESKRLIETQQAAAVDAITERLDNLRLSPLTKLDLMQVLECRVMRSHRAVFKYIASNQQGLGLSEKDVEAIVEHTAVSDLMYTSKVCRFLGNPALFSTDIIHSGQNAEGTGRPIS